MGRVIFLLIVAILAWFGFQYVNAVYDNVQIRDLMEAAMIQHHAEKTDSLIVEDVVAGISKRGPFTVRWKDVQVSREDDGKEIIVDVPYFKTITIPLIGKKWILRFHPSAKLRFDFQ